LFLRWLKKSPRQQNPAPAPMNLVHPVRCDDKLNVTGLAVPVMPEPNVLEDKARKMLNGIQNRLNLQQYRWSLAGGFVFQFNAQTSPGQNDQRWLFSSPAKLAASLQTKTNNGRAFEPLARARLRSSGEISPTGTPLYQ
jgi:hypothetical protein